MIGWLQLCYKGMSKIEINNTSPHLIFSDGLFFQWISYSS